jgi:hypothetical protein
MIINEEVKWEHFMVYSEIDKNGVKQLEKFNEDFSDMPKNAD